MLEPNDGPFEAELLLLICNLFPTGYNIPIEDLAAYGMSLELFEGVNDNDMIEARHRVLDLIKIINQRYFITLQLQDDLHGNQCVKKLAGALDVATWNASTYQFVFRREATQEKWPETTRYENCCGLSLVLKKIIEHPTLFECPKLSILQLQLKCPQCLPVDFFQGMKELRVLSLGVPSLSRPLDLPRKLRALKIKVLKLENVFVVGSLRDLEFLSISTQFLSHIPKEMGNLGNLRFLNLSKMYIGYIPPGVLSRMLKLEELLLPLSFREWGSTPKEYDHFNEFEDSREEDDCCYEERITTKDGGNINAAASEIASLLSLHTLQVCVPNASVLSSMSPVFENIQKFKIVVQDKFRCQPLGNHSTNELQLTGDASGLNKTGVSYLLRRTGVLSLKKVKDLNNVMCQLDNEDIPRLEKMIITECDDLECVVDSTEKRISSASFSVLKILHLSMLHNLREICHGLDPVFFQNLRQINTRFCHKLKYLFQAIALGSMPLESIEILDCLEMEGIFVGSKADNNTLDRVHGYRIRYLNLQSLPKLAGFLATKDNEIDGVHVNTDKLLTTNKVALNKKKDASSYTELYSFLPEELTTRLNQLKYLRIAFCDQLKVIFVLMENKAKTKVLNSLIELELHSLQNLVHIWFKMPENVQAFQKLRVLRLSECHNSYLLSSRVAKLLVHLHKIEVSHCEKMEKIVVEDENAADDIVVFPELKVLELQHMPKLLDFYDGAHVKLPSLQTLKLIQCKKMKCFSRIFYTPILKRMQINGSIYSIISDVNTTMNWHAEGWDNWPMGFPIHPFQHINRWMKEENSRSKFSSSAGTTKLGL